MPGILDVLTPVLGPIIDRVFPDPKERHDFQLKLMEIADREEARQHEENMGQIGTNTAEASNSNLFVAGWRPAVGWVCAIGVGYSFVLEPLAAFIAKLCGYGGDFPALDMGNLMTLIMGMLGMGYLRTKEKMGGIPDSQVLPSAASAPSAPAPVSPPKKKVLGIPWPF